MTGSLPSSPASEPHGLHRALVTAQFALILAVAWRGDVVAPGWGLAVQAAGLGLIAWASVTMTRAQGRLFSVTPSPARHAVLCTGGPYRFVRHPMYLAVLLVGWPAAWWGRPGALVAMLLLTAVLLIKLRVEERALARKFEGWRAYAARSAALVPMVW